MPDRRLSLFVRLVLQNGGRLSERKRPQFEELSDEEIESMEAAVSSARDSVPVTREPEARPRNPSKRPVTASARGEPTVRPRRHRNRFSSSGS